MNRSKLREIIIKALYQIFIYEEKNIVFNIDDIVDEQIKYIEETDSDKKKYVLGNREYLINTVNYVYECKYAIIDIANKHMKDWTIDRLSKVDQAIIHLAIYELKNKDIPDVVAINEAIELSKKYSDEKVTKLINGVLDKIMHEGEEVGR